MEANRLTRFAAQLGGKLGVAVCVVGFVLIFLGWNGAASFNDLRQQFPYLISGGIAGLGLVAVGVALMIVEAARAERAELQTSIEELRRAIESAGSIGAGGGGAGQATTAVASGMVVAGRGSYHRPDCRLVKGRGDRLPLIPESEAEEEGLAPCRICAPSAQPKGRLRAR